MSRTAYYLMIVFLAILQADAWAVRGRARRGRPRVRPQPPVTTQPVAQPSPTSQPAATASATQPASDIVLVRIGNRATVTQADFDLALRGAPVAHYMKRLRSVMTYLTHRRLFDVFVEDHHLISDEELDKRIERDMKLTKVESLDVLKKNLQSQGTTLKAYRRMTRSAMAEAALSEQGIERGKDEALLKKMFETRKQEFDGTYVTARHIMLLVAPYETPAEKEAKRKRILQMRNDIESGKRTWEECVAESDSRQRQGNLDGFTRHFMKNEFLSAAAFQLEVGKLSDVVETPLGFHIIQVTERVPGNRTFEKAKSDIQKWLTKEAYINGIDEVTRKYPIIGIQPPSKPANPGPPPPPTLRMPRLKKPRAPATRPATNPARKKSRH